MCGVDGSAVPMDLPSACSGGKRGVREALPEHWVPQQWIISWFSGLCRQGNPIAFSILFWNL